MAASTVAAHDRDASDRSRHQRWGTVGRSLSVFGLFWLACLLAFGLGVTWVGQLMSEPPASTQSVALTATATFAFLTAAAVLPWVGIATAVGAWKAGAGARALVALALNSVAALLVVVGLGLVLLL